MDFFRLVWLPDLAWTLSFIANTGEGRSAKSAASEFEPAYAVKLDHIGSDSYFSLIGSYTEKDLSRLGGFWEKTISDALLVYTEGSVQKGADVLYPEADESRQPGWAMRAIRKNASTLYPAALVGASYTLLSGPVLTAEYLYNGLGYDDGLADDYLALRGAAADAFNAPGSTGDAARSLLGQTADINLRFLRQHYLMLQYLQNDIKNVLSITLRLIYNIEDGGGRWISIMNWDLTDHLQLFSVGSANTGSHDTEFRSVIDWQWVMGFQYTF
jgi:hypothetical protein